MRLAVCVKQVRIVGDEIMFRDDGADVSIEEVDFSLNEWDSYATEEALRLRETHGGEVVAVTYGDENADAVLRRCLAMGVDRAARVVGDATDPIAIAGELAAALAAEAPDLVLCGVQSSDSVQAATGAAIAELIGLPCVAVVTRLEVQGGVALVHRELEGGLVDVMEVDLPALITIQTGINEPRYANLRAIKQAEQLTIPVLESSPGHSTLRVQSMYVPEARVRAESLGNDPASVAARITELVKERLG